MLKRFISVLLVLLMIIGCAPAGAFASEGNGSDNWTNPFSDVKEGQWFYDAVKFVNVNKIFEGKTPTTFSPAGDMTRAMFVTALGRYAGVDKDEYGGKTEFSDVDEKAYYAPYVKWASENEITLGSGEGRFNVDGKVTREQIATFFYRYIKKFNIELDLDESKALPKDMGKVSDYAIEAVTFLWNADVFNGDQDGNFAPGKPANRAEAATIFMNLAKKLEDSGEGGTGEGGTGGDPGDDVDPPVDTSIYTVSFNFDDHVKNDEYGTFDPISVKSGECITNLPEPDMGDSTDFFGGWFTESQKLNRFNTTTPVTKDLTLYASYIDLPSNELDEDFSTDTFILSDQEETLSFDIVDRSNGMLASQAAQKVALYVLDQSEEVSLDITGGEGTFRADADGGFTPGASYRMTLLDERLSFDGQEENVRNCEFTIERDENYELELNDGIIYINRDELANIMQNGQKIDSLSVPVMKVGDDGEDIDVYGSFEYKTNNRLRKADTPEIEVGSILCVYSGESPLLENSDPAREDISYVKVTSVSGDKITYSDEVEMEEVLVLPETIPLSVDILEEEPSETADGMVVKYHEDKLNLEDFTSFGLSSETVIDEGDYVAIYYGEDVFTVMDEGSLYGVITMVETDENGIVTILFDETTLEEITAQDGFYEEEAMDTEKALETVDMEEFNKDIVSQAYESGFVESAAQYMAAIVLETESVKESIPGDYELDMDLGELTLPVLNDRNLEKLSNVGEGISTNAKGDVDFEHVHVKPELTTNTRKISNGIRCALTVSFVLKIDLGENRELAIDLSASFVEEFGITMKTWLDTEWFLCFVKEWIVNVAVDVENYSAFNFDAVITTGADSQQIDIKDELKYVLSCLDEAEAAEGMRNLFELYKEMVSDAAENTDYINVVEEELFEQVTSLAFGIIQVKIGINFVIGINVHVALGVSFDYINGTRYLFWTRVFENKSGSDTLSLIDEEYNFQFYVMGKFGIRVGLELEFAIGLFSVKVNSIGLTAGAGVYVELYGYFFYEMNVVKKTIEGKPQKIKTSSASGALYLEMGMYLEVNFKAQVLDGKFAYEYPIVDKQFPLLTAGSIDNVTDFAYSNKSYLVRDTLVVDTSSKVMAIPDSYFNMMAMDMTDGMIFSQYYAPTNFTLSFDNSEFEQNAQEGDPPVFSGEDGIVVVNPPKNSTAVRTKMTITWKQAPLTFSKLPLCRTVDVLWSIAPLSVANKLYDVTVYAGLSSRPIWKTQCLYGKTPELPTIAELLAMPEISQYNYVTAKGERLNLKYMLEKAPKTMEAPYTVTGPQSYRINVPERQYTLVAKNILHSSGYVSERTYTKRLGEFLMEYDEFANTGYGYYKPGNFINLHYPDGRTTTSVNRGLNMTHTLAKLVLDGGYISPGYDDTAAYITYYYKTNDGGIIPPYTVKATTDTAVARFPTGHAMYHDYEVVYDPYSSPDDVIWAREGSNSYEILCRRVKGHKIEYDLNGGYFDTAPKTSYNTSKSGNIFLTTPVHDYATFDGWYCESLGKTITTIPPNTYGNLSLVARWSPIEYSYTLWNGYYVGNGMSGSTHTYYANTPKTLKPISRNHYIFEGWYDNAKYNGKVYTEIAAGEYGKKSFYAKWSPVQINVNLELDGGTVLSGIGDKITYSYGETTYLPGEAHMFKPGYTFEYWSYNGTPITGNLRYKFGGTATDYTVTANWAPTKYTITYNNNKTVTKGSYYYGDTVSLPTDLTLAGKTFAGWYLDEACETYPVTTISDDEYGDRSFYAKWTTNVYKITYNVSSSYGTKFKDDYTPINVFTYGTTIRLPEAKHLDFPVGCKFAGWTVKQKGNALGTEINTKLSADAEVTAKWVPNTYSVNYFGYYSAGVPLTSKYTYGVGLDLSAYSSMTKNGYTFAGLYDNPEFEGNAITSISATSAENINLYAKWGQNTLSYNLELDGGSYIDGYTPPASSVLYDETFSLAEIGKNVEKTGHDFVGWIDGYITDPEGKLPPAPNFVGRGEVAKFESGKTITAYWKPQTYRINFDTNGGAWVPSVSRTSMLSYEYSDTAKALPRLYVNGSANEMVANRIGYTFNGWLLNGDTTPVWEIPANSIGDINAVASWSLIEYTATFDVKGGTYSNPELSQPTKFTVESRTSFLRPVKEGYTFSGWIDSDENSCSSIRSGRTVEWWAQNQTFTATWTPKTYAIYFSLGDAVLDESYILPSSYTYGERDIVLPTGDEITLEGCTLLGWYDSSYPSTIFTEIPKNSNRYFRLYPKWSGNTYSISYELNGGEYDSSSLPQDSFTYSASTLTVSLPSAVKMKKTGYEFKGWFDNPSFEGSPVTSFKRSSPGDKTFHAKWEMLDYTITFNAGFGTFADGYNKPTEYSYGDSVLLPTADEISKTGHTFLGWYDNANFYGTRITEIKSDETGNREFYAKWSINSYTITLVTNEGIYFRGYVPTKGFTYKSTLPNSVSLPDYRDISKVGHIFRGWYEDPTFASGDPVTFISMASTSDQILYAKWDTSSYNISYVLGSNASFVEGYTPTTSIKFNGEPVVLPTAEDVQRPGYTFAGWSDPCAEFGQEILYANDAKTTGSRTLTAVWTPINYSLTFNKNGGILNFPPTSYNLERISSIILPSPTRTGCKFEGWYTTPEFNEGTKIDGYYIPVGTTGDLVLYAKWSGHTYGINYVLNGGTLAEGAPKTYVYEQEETLPIPSKVGYNFQGWYSRSAPFFPEYKVTTVPAGTVNTFNVYADWGVAIQYKINLNYNGGALSKYFEPYYDIKTPVTLPDQDGVRRLGYSFAGWYDNPEFDGEECTSASGNGDKSFYAKWEEAVYSITYNADGGDLPDDHPETYAFGTGATLPIPTKTGSTFKGWYKEASLRNRVTEIGANEINDKVFYAKWEPTRYYINYVPNGGTMSSTLTAYYYGDTVTLKDSNDITREGFTFGGWYSDMDCETTAVTQVTDTEYGDKAFYAKWIGKDYTITFDNGGGELPVGHITGYTSGTTVVLPIPTKIGSTFMGWYTESTFNNRVSEIDANTHGNKQYFAKWSEDAYEINLHAEGGRYVTSYNPPISYNYSTTAVQLPTSDYISRTGYTFGGWYAQSDFGESSKATEIAAGETGAKTFYAKWIKDVYQITINKNGGEYRDGFDIQTSYSYGDSITLPTSDDILRVGYSFDGWYAAGVHVTEISPLDTGDITLEAYWSPINYTIIYEMNNGEFNGSVDESYNIESSITLPTSTHIERDGYEFMGWYFESDFSGQMQTGITAGTTGNKTYYAKWRLINYTVRLMPNYSTSIQPEEYRDAEHGVAFDLSTTELDELFSGDNFRNNYTFDGWNTVAKGGTEATAFKNTIPVDGVPADCTEITLYAQWIRGEDTEPEISFKVIVGTEEGEVQTGTFEEAFEAKNLAGSNSKLEIMLTDDIVVMKSYSIPDGVTIDGQKADGSCYTISVPQISINEDGTENTEMDADELEFSQSIFDVAHNSTVTIKNTIFIGGIQHAVSNHGDLTMENVTIKRAGQTGLANDNKALIKNSLITTNGGNGILVDGNDGQLVLENSTVMKNGGWGIYIQHMGDVYTTNSTIANNAGGISVGNEGNAYILNTTVAGNVTTNETAGIKSSGKVTAINSVILGNKNNQGISNIASGHGVVGDDPSQKYYFCVFDKNETLPKSDGSQTGNIDILIEECITADGATAFKNYKEGLTYATAFEYEDTGVTTYVVEIDEAKLASFAGGCMVHFDYTDLQNIELAYAYYFPWAAEIGEMIIEVLIGHVDQGDMKYTTYYQGGDTDAQESTHVRRDAAWIVGAFTSAMPNEEAETNLKVDITDENGMSLEGRVMNQLIHIMIYPNDVPDPFVNGNSIDHNFKTGRALDINASVMTNPEEQEWTFVEWRHRETRATISTEELLRIRLFDDMDIVAIFSQNPLEHDKG